jgi:hypothetical protein
VRGSTQVSSQMIDYGGNVINTLAYITTLKM